MGKISSSPLGFEHQTAQSVQGRYTDYSIHYKDNSDIKYKLEYLQASLDVYCVLHCKLLLCIKNSWIYTYRTASGFMVYVSYI